MREGRTASGHRRHHRFSDRPGDPHSPVLGGFWHAHLGWVLSGENDRPNLANVREFSRFPELRFLDRFKWIPTLATGAACALAFGWPGFVWGFGIATTLAFHAPLFVNSAGHTRGASSARHGFAWWEVDVTYYAIWSPAKLGVVWDVREPRARSLTRPP